MRKHLLLVLLVAPTLALAADLPPDSPWGPPAGDLASRLTITGPLAKGTPIHAIAELRNTSQRRLTITNLRAWLLLAQGSSTILFTSPTLGPATATLDPNASLQIPFDAAPLAAFPYTKDIVIKNGLPLPDPASKNPAPPSLGKLTDLLPDGPLKAKAFLVAIVPGTLSDVQKTTVIPSATIALTVADTPFPTLTPAQQQSTLDQIARLFQSDAGSAQIGHDRALRIGPSIAPRLAALIHDPALTPAGRAWLTTTLVDLHDPHALAGLIVLLQQGGDGAYIIAYLGPKLHDSALTAAVQSATTSSDPALVSWAARGLGLAGATLDPSLFPALLDHTDPAARIEAADLLTAHKSPQAIPYLAKLLADDNIAVRIHTAKAIADLHRNDPQLIAALETMSQLPDAATQAAAKDALSRLTTK